MKISHVIAHMHVIRKKIPYDVEFLFDTGYYRNCIPKMLLPHHCSELFTICRYPYSSDVGTYTPYYTGQTQVPATTMGYDSFSTDIADSTTYDPRPGLDPLVENGGLMTNVVTTGNHQDYIEFVLIRVFFLSHTNYLQNKNVIF